MHFTSNSQGEYRKLTRNLRDRDTIIFNFRSAIMFDYTYSNRSRFVTSTLNLKVCQMIKLTKRSCLGQPWDQTIQKVTLKHTFSENPQHLIRNSSCSQHVVAEESQKSIVLLFTMVCYKLLYSHQVQLIVRPKPFNVCYEWPTHTTMHWPQV